MAAMKSPRGHARRPRRPGVVPQRRRGRHPAALPARRPGDDAQLHRPARGSRRSPPGDLLRPARLRAFGPARRHVAVDGAALRARGRGGARRARPRPVPPVRQLVGRAALHAVHPRLPAGVGDEPGDGGQPGKHAALGGGLHAAAGGASRRRARGDRAARGPRLHLVPRVSRRGRRVLPAASLPPAAVARRARALLRRDEPRGLRDDERPERIHRHRPLPRLGRVRPAGRDRRAHARHGRSPRRDPRRPSGPTSTRASRAPSS